MTDPSTERMARSQGAYEHPATKAALAQLETRIAQMETRMTWRLIGASGAIIAAAALIEMFL